MRSNLKSEAHLKTALFARIIGIAWRGVCVGLAYLAGLMAAGVMLGMLGLIKPASGGGSGSLLWLFLAAMVVGWTLGPVAQQMAIGRRRHLLIWSSIIFFNFASVMIEGAFFEPAAVPLPIPVLAVQQLLASLVAGLAITLLFAPAQAGARPAWAGRHRPWYEWGWRFIASSFSYLVFYLVFGAINYSLITKPYYDAHAGGLAVPPATTIWLVEMVRAPLIVLSVLLFLLALRASRRRTIILTGMILFMIGGVAPLLFQVNVLPGALLIASAVEIFLQNFSTGAVVAVLLGSPAPEAAPRAVLAVG
jgi:hypothetical protein